MGEYSLGVANPLIRWDFKRRRCLYVANHCAKAVKRRRGLSIDELGIRIRRINGVDFYGTRDVHTGNDRLCNYVYCDYFSADLGRYYGHVQEEKEGKLS